MTVETLLLALCVGGAFLALWVDVRFPDLAPADLWRAVVRLLFAVAVGHFVTPGLVLAIEAGIAPGVALMTLALPAIVLFFLAAVWMMRVVQATMYGVRR
jgi:hypothetical protein